MLQPDALVPAMKSRAHELSGQIARLEAALRCAPEGRLRIACKKTPNYYWVKDSADTLGVYLKAMDPLIAFLAQKNYDAKILAGLKMQLRCIERFLSEYRAETPLDVLDQLSPERLALVQPLFLTDEEYKKRWLQVPYEGKDFPENAAEHYTSSGVRVRSKSEVIIADTLMRLGIPYRYEYPHRMKIRKGRHTETVTMYPDFTCLNMCTRCEVIWEHFGLVDDPTYAENFVLKLRTFRQNGFFEGVNLLFTQETSDNPLNAKDIEILAKHFFYLRSL